MRKKQVWRYYCEFCKKANCSGASISKHEERCTNNPNRVCGMCKMLKNPQPSLDVLKALLPKPTGFISDLSSDIWGNGEAKLEKAVTLALPDLRKAADNCPACILAALRQAKIPVPLATGFDFGTECKEIWQQVNEDREYRHC